MVGCLEGIMAPWKRAPCHRWRADYGKASGVNIMVKKCASLFVFLIAIVPAISPAATTVSQILASPSTYDGSHVDVSGKVSKLEQKVSHKGNPYVTFSLCAGQCVHVFAFGTPGISDGQTLIVHGTFAAVKHVGGYTFYNEVDADDGSIH